jgi:hypothetical protein
MVSVITAIQGPPPFASAPSALSVLNTLILTFFLVGIGLLLLLVINANKRSSMKGGAQKTAKRPGKKGSRDDLISQLPYMTKEELRAMALQAKTAAQAQPETPIAASQVGGDREVSSATSPQTGQDHESTAVARGTPTAPQAPGSLECFTTPAEPARQGPALEVTVVIDIAMAEAKKDEKEPVRPKHKYADSVERSVLSNEFPEEFKRKSRKI